MGAGTTEVLKAQAAMMLFPRALLPTHLLIGAARALHSFSIFQLPTRVGAMGFSPPEPEGTRAGQLQESRQPWGTELDRAGWGTRQRTGRARSGTNQDWGWGGHSTAGQSSNSREESSVAEAPQLLTRGMGRETLQPPASIRGETLPATRDKAARAQRCSPQRGSLKVAFRAYNTRAVLSSALGAARDGVSDRMDHQLAPNGNTHHPGAIIIGAERFRPS